MKRGQNLFADQPRRDRRFPWNGLAALRVMTLLFLAASPRSGAAADNWPELRGAERNGNAPGARIPLTWSETNHIAWKVPVHDLGWSSPVVFDQQIWLTTATENGSRMFAVGLDAETGRVVHDVKVFDTPEVEHIANVNSYASPTPAIESGRVYVHFGTYGTACVDTGDGRILWSRRDLKCDHHEGPGASLLLDGDRLYIPVDGRDVQYLIALDKATGRTVWKTERSVDYSPFPVNCRKAFCTPIVIDAAGRRQGHVRLRSSVWRGALESPL